jgi:hypothetical protein
MLILAIRNLYSQHRGGRPTKHKRVISQDTRGSIPGMQGDGFASEPGGIMEVAM